MITTNFEGNIPQRISFISGRSILAGFFIAFLGNFILTMLGWGLGAVPAAHIFSFGGPTPINLTMTLWFAFSAFVSLGVGAYFATRVSHLFTSKMGSAYGLVISSLFLFVVVTEYVATIQQTTPETEAQVGWAVFSTLVLGTFGSIMGGSMAARINDLVPVEKKEAEEARVALRGISREPAAP